MTKKRAFPIICPLIVACALFMENLDSSVISTALPSIAKSLGTDPLHLNLAITSYLLSLAVFIPLSGWMADRFGANTIFRAAIALFTLSSVACGLSNSLFDLVLARLVQGVGGAMMVPVGRLVILKSVPKNELVSAMAWLTLPALLGPVLGPPVGGFIVTYFSWHWIFFINVPIGILGIVLATRYIHNTREPNPAPLDLPGFFLMALGLAGLVFGFENIGKNFLPPHALALLLFIGITCTGAYTVYARRILHPIVDLKLFRLKTFFAASVGGGLMRLGVGALPFILPLMLQMGFGYTPLESGMLTFASAAGAMFMKTAATRIIRRFGFRPILIANGIATALFIAGCALFRPTTPHLVIFGFLLVGGFFRSLQFTSLNTLAFADVDPVLMSKATTLSSMMQQLALSLGVGTGAIILNSTLKLHHSATLQAGDFWPSFLLIGIISASSIFFFMRLPDNAGDEVSGHKTLAGEVKPSEPA